VGRYPGRPARANYRLHLPELLFPHRTRPPWPGRRSPPVKRRHALVLMAAVLLALAGCGGNSWSSGDRVIVPKFLYDTPLEDPQSYLVVCSKPPEPPAKNLVPTNYTNRLMGLPGELLAILFGRIYRCDDEPSRKLREDLDQVGRSKTPEDLWNLRYLERDDR